MPEHWYLKITSAVSTRTLPLTDEPVTFGRHRGNVVPLTDDRASRYHCVIERRGSQVRVTDLGSRNGTRVNEQKIHAADLKPGDKVKIGGVQIEVCVGSAPVVASESPIADVSNKDAEEVVDAVDPTTTAYSSQPWGSLADRLLHETDAQAAALLKAARVPSSTSKTPPPTSTDSTSDEKTHPSHSPRSAHENKKPVKHGSSSQPVKSHAGSEPSSTDSAYPMLRAPAGDRSDDQTVAAGVELELDDPGSEHPHAFRKGREFITTPVVNALGTAGHSPAGTPVDQERTLRAILAQVPEGPVKEAEIVFVNARGQKMKMPPPGSAPGKEGVVFLRLFLLLCSRTTASDIHVEPKRDDGQVRIRVDGMMVETLRLSLEVMQRMIGVVKVLSDLDISLKNAVQDGHFSSFYGNRRVDYRVSFAPSMYGQSLVIRVLDMLHVPKHIKELGMPNWMSQNIHSVVQQDQGMLIVCGPTGSGKTTSLYAAIRDIDIFHRNVITIEDPPEFNIDGVTQMACNEQQGNTFATLLRSVLRQDPDVVLVGEIRDAETARIAMQAAMTGHLVLTTVHAKDGIGTIFRLLDLGVEPFLIASALNLVLSQRLVRKLCDDCKIPAKPKLEHISRLGKYAQGLSRIYYPGGCPRCLGTGYVGRQGLYELLSATEELRDVILKTPSINQLRKATNITMFASLRDSGFHLVSNGITSLDEIDRVLGMD